jgi:putative endonuclease
MVGHCPLEASILVRIQVPQLMERSEYLPRGAKRATWGIPKMKYFVYILECADKSLYAGCTNDLEKRVKAHNELKCGAHYTKIRRPVKLKYFETFRSFNKARKREAEIKTLDRKKKLELINK